MTVNYQGSTYVKKNVSGGARRHVGIVGGNYLKRLLWFLSQEQNYKTIK